MDRRSNKNGRGQGGNNRPILPQAGIDQGQRSAVPPHLGVSWVNHELTAAKLAFKDLRRELKALKKKVSADRVHSSRVTLRRWLSVWNVLRQDGWQTEQYKSRIGKPLRRLQKLLGQTRDLDVNIEWGKKLGCSKSLLKQWAKEREKAQAELEEYVDEKDIGKILDRLSEFLPKQAAKIKAGLPRAKSDQSAYHHIELYLVQQESVVREQAEGAHTAEEFHQLRLSIKRWRYLLTEFFGLTNLELVRAQQLLGQLHDLDRLTPVLVHDEDEEKALQNLKERRKQLLNQIEQMRHRLPYGLRPEIISTKPALGAGLPR